VEEKLSAAHLHADIHRFGQMAISFIFLSLKHAITAGGWT